MLLKIRWLKTFATFNQSYHLYSKEKELYNK